MMPCDLWPLQSATPHAFLTRHTSVGLCLFSGKATWPRYCIHLCDAVHPADKPRLCGWTDKKPSLLGIPSFLCLSLQGLVDQKSRETYNPMATAEHDR